MGGWVGGREVIIEGKGGRGGKGGRKGMEGGRRDKGDKEWGEGEVNTEGGGRKGRTNEETRATRMRK